MKIHSKKGLVINPAISDMAKLVYELTRPADTTAYSANDAVNSSVAVPAVIELPGAANELGGGGIAMMMKLESNMTDLAGKTIRVWFYNGTPANVVGDNVAFVNSFANRTKRSFYVDVTFDALLVGSDTVIGMVDLSKEFICDPASTSLFVLLQTLAAFTPTSGGKIYMALSVVKLA